MAPRDCYVITVVGLYNPNENIVVHADEPFPDRKARENYRMLHPFATIVNSFILNHKEVTKDMAFRWLEDKASG